MKYAREAQRKRLNWSRPDVLMGEICRARGNDEEALDHYLRASVNGDTNPDFNRLLLQMLFQRQRNQEAEDVVYRLEKSQAAMSPDVKRSVTSIDVHSADFDIALKNAKKNYDPGSDDYGEHLWHGQILMILARRARLENHLKELPEIVAAAEQSFRKAIEIAPTAAECRVELVLLLVSADEMAKARKAAAEAEFMIPSDVAPLAMAYVHEATGDKEQAAASYEKALQLQPENPRVLRTIAEYYIRNRDSQRAAPLVDKLLGGQLTINETDRRSARRMKAELLLARGERKQALAMIEQNLVPPPGAAEDRRVKVRILMADPATARARETLVLMESLVKGPGATPEPRDRYDLALLYLHLDQWDRCRDQMEALVNAKRSETQFLAPYVKMLLDQGETRDAASRLENLEAASKPGTAVDLRAELMFRQGNWHAVIKDLTDYLDKPGVVPEKRADRAVLVARLFEGFGNRLTKPTERATAQAFFEHAAALWEENAKSGPSSEMKLAAFYARRGQLDEALKRLRQSAAKADPRELAVAALSVVNAEKVTPNQLKELEAVLASATAAEKPTILLSTLGVLKIAQNQYDKAEDFYRQVLARDAGDFRAYNNLALLLVLSEKQENLNEALDLIKRAIELAGSQPGLLDSLAVVRVARGEPQQALELLEGILNDPAEKLNPDYPIWLFHKARALYAAKEVDQARDVLHVAKTKYDLKRAQIDPPERRRLRQAREGSAELSGSSRHALWTE